MSPDLTVSFWLFNTLPGVSSPHSDYEGQENQIGVENIPNDISSSKVLSFFQMALSHGNKDSY